MNTQDSAQVANKPIPPGHFSIEGDVLASTAKAWLIEIHYLGDKEVTEKRSLWFPISQCFYSLTVPKESDELSFFIFPLWLCEKNKMQSWKLKQATQVNQSTQGNDHDDDGYDDDIPF